MSDIPHDGRYEQIRRLYLELLGREPDPGGIAHYHASGWPIGHISGLIEMSAERRAHLEGQRGGVCVIGNPDTTDGLGLVARELGSAFEGGRFLSGFEPWWRSPLVRHARLVVLAMPPPLIAWPLEGEWPEARVVWYTMFEATRVPESWVERLSRASRVYVTTDAVLNAMLRSGVRVPIEVAGYGGPVREASITREPLRLRFGLLATAIHRKNIPDTIRAFIAVRSHYPEVTLHIHTKVGEPPTEQKISALLPHDGITWTRGPITEEQLDRFYASIDALLLVSRSEGLSRVPREAAARGIPSVLSCIDAHVPLGPVSLLVTQHGPALRYEWEPGLWEGARSDGYYANFAVEDIAEQIEAMIHRPISAFHRPGPDGTPHGPFTLDAPWSDVGRTIERAPSAVFIYPWLDRATCGIAAFVRHSRQGLGEPTLAVSSIEHALSLLEKYGAMTVVYVHHPSNAASITALVALIDSARSKGARVVMDMHHTVLDPSGIGLPKALFERGADIVFHHPDAPRAVGVGRYVPLPVPPIAPIEWAPLGPEHGGDLCHFGIAHRVKRFAQMAALGQRLGRPVHCYGPGASRSQIELYCPPDADLSMLRFDDTVRTDTFAAAELGRHSLALGGRSGPGNELYSSYSARFYAAAGIPMLLDTHPVHADMAPYAPLVDFGDIDALEHAARMVLCSAEAWTGAQQRAMLARRAMHARKTTLALLGRPEPEER